MMLNNFLDRHAPVSNHAAGWVVTAIAGARGRSLPERGASNSSFWPFASVSLS